MGFENFSPYKQSDDLETRVGILSGGYRLDYPDPSEISKLLEPLEKKAILDVGCGIGIPLLPFGPQFRDTPNMIGLDSSLAVLKRAQELQRQQDLPTLHLIHGDAQNLPFLDQQFDLVLARHMLYHVPNIPKAVGEIVRVMKPTGLFMATTNSKYSRPELEKIHREALLLLPDASFIERGSSRFGLENGEKILGESFSSIQTIPWHGYIRYTSADDAIKYYTSTLYFQHALSDSTQKEQLKNIVANEVQTVINQQGYFQVTSWGAIFLAHP